jgi:hypothetical protein
VVELLEEIAANQVHGKPHQTIASRRAHRLISDLDAGELIWPSWKEKGRPGGRPSSGVRI